MTFSVCNMWVSQDNKAITSQLRPMKRTSKVCCTGIHRTTIKFHCKTHDVNNNALE